MSKILVGFDFSSGSAKAVDLAIDISNRVGFDLRLVYVKKENDDENAIRQEIERRIEGVRPLFKGIDMDYVLCEGKVSQQLCQQAEECDATLIVVGSHGMSGFSKTFLGRNTYRTIAESRVPVLTLREDFNFNKNLERIVVPIDSSPDTRQKVRTAAQFAKIFGSELHILGLYTSDNKTIKGIVDGYVRMVASYLDRHEIKHIDKFVRVPKNLTTTTLEYADQINADMIVIMTEQESNLTSLLLGNYAQQMLTESSRPVCTLRAEQVNGLAK
ncbi:MAG: universal stress protein [Bacteroidales bacterium]|nr:universal stress protein [Candidatus Colimorpha merdihippi]MCQ2282560.1 universal stress protein [Bacteroidales bacterium]